MMADGLTAASRPTPLQQRGQKLVDRLNGKAPPPVRSGSTMPSIGIARGVASARGLTHIPYIEAMDELGLKPSIIAGCSIGALLGAGWANGMSGKELRSHAFDVLGTMKVIAGRIWGGQFRNLGALLHNG